MTLRRRLVAIMIVLVALGLSAVDAFTLHSLATYMFGRVDAQLGTASDQLVSFVGRAEDRGFAVTPASVSARVSPDIYVEIVAPSGRVTLSKPSVSGSTPDPAPGLPVPLPVRPAPDVDRTTIANQPYQPDSAAQTISSVVHNGPQYRMEATPLPGATLVVATRLDTVNATLNSLRTIEIVLSVGLLLVLLVLITVLIRLGLRPLEDMSADADAIAAGDLTRRVHPTEGESEVARLGRALNGMLAQIESAFAQRARSEDHLRSFLADASHELRTPLTSIQGYAELLRKDALADDAARDRALSRIEKEAARMGALVGDLAVLAREGEGPEPTRYRVDLAAVVAEAVTDARALDRTRRIELSALTEAPVAGDDARLAQMVHNLLRNALAHTPVGTPVEVEVVVRGDRVLLRVRDHGPGMSAEEASRAFDRFYRGEAGQRGGGSGLGLFIVERLARSFDGTVSVQTEEGQGALFEVDLPRYGARSRGAGTVRPAAGARPGASRDGGNGSAGSAGSDGGAGTEDEAFDRARLAADENVR
jgi:two-component system, OmpR family, sensor kinase